MAISTSFWTVTEITSSAILHGAIVNRDFVRINRILKSNEIWKASDDEGETVLHLAFKYKEKILDDQQAIIQTLKCFLDEGLSVNLKNTAGHTVLFLAIEDRLRDVVDFLLKRGADVNARDPGGNSCVHFLIEDQFKKFSVNSNKDERLESRQTFEHEDIDFMIWLLSKGVNVDCRNNDGKTPLHLAIERNLQHVMPILIKYMHHVNYIDEAGCTIIEWFFKTKTSMNIRQAPNPTYIYNFYYNSRYDIDIVKFLLNKGVSVDNIDEKGNTLVHTFLKSYDRNPEIIRWMLQRYTKVNAKNKDGNTALHLVIDSSITILGQHKKSTIDFVRILLFKGADVHLKNSCGDTPVRQAIRVKHTEVLQALAEYGADLSPSKNVGDLLLHEICTKYYPSIDDEICGPIVDMLVRAGWDVNAIRPSDGFTPLMEACIYGCPAIAQKLIDNGANVHYAEKTNLMRPMHMAIGIRADRHGTGSTLFQMLAKAGADVNVKNVHGKTVLHLASHRDGLTIKTLLELGADVEASDCDGRLPLHEAIKDRNLHGISVLLEFGADFNDESVVRELNEIVNDTLNDDSSIEDAEDIDYYLTKQWIKFKAANLPVIEVSVNYADYESLQQFHVGCLEEVETLKTHHLDDRTTLYDLLRMDVHLKCVFMANNGRLRKLVKSSALGSSFPKYQNLIFACYNKAVARYPLIEPAKRAWYSLTGIDLPDLCVTRILFYLKNEDLRRMAEEEDETNSLKRPIQLTFDELAKKTRLA